MSDELQNTRGTGSDSVGVTRDNRRGQERSRLIIDVFYDGIDATGIASTRDVGSGGLYLNTKTAIPQGAVLLLRIPFGDKQIVVNAEVVYSNPGRGIGLQFHGLSPEDKALLETGLARD